MPKILHLACQALEGSHIESSEDPLSELSIRRRIKFLRDSKSTSDGVVFIPESWAKADPALEWGVQNLDWLKIEKPRGEPTG